MISLRIYESKTLRKRISLDDRKKKEKKKVVYSQLDRGIYVHSVVGLFLVKRFNIV